MSIDRREDAGEFYPGGKAVATTPVAAGGDVKHAEFEDVTVETNTIPNLRAAVRELAAKLGATVVSALAVCAAIGAGVETAKLNELDLDDDPSVVVGVSLEGLATTGDVSRVASDAAQELAGATNAVMGEVSRVASNAAQELAGATNKVYGAAKDYTDSAVAGATNKVYGAAKDYTDSAVAGATPGDYANVSNRAVNALSRAEAEAGFTEWKILGDGVPNTLVRQPWISDGYWQVEYSSYGRTETMPSDEPASTTDTVISMSGGTWYIGRTRLPTMADATLTPVYSDTPTFSAWTISPQANITLLYTDDTTLGWIAYSDEWGDWVGVLAPRDATELSFTGFDGINYTATRVRTDIIGYTLGAQTNSVVASTNAVAVAASDLRDGIAVAAAAATNYTDAAIASIPTGPGYTVTNTTAVIAYNVGKETVAIPAGGTLSADLSGWRDGEQCYVVLSPAGAYDVAAGLRLLGYGTWPTNTTLCVAFRHEQTVFVNTIAQPLP